MAFPATFISLPSSSSASPLPVDPSPTPPRSTSYIAVCAGASDCLEARSAALFASSACLTCPHTAREATVSLQPVQAAAPPAPPPRLSCGGSRLPARNSLATRSNRQTPASVAAHEGPRSPTSRDTPPVEAVCRGCTTSITPHRGRARFGRSRSNGGEPRAKRPSRRRLTS